MRIEQERLWYFAHPYTGAGTNKALIEEANFRLCVQRTCKLIEAGYAVFSPIVHSHLIETFSSKILSLSEDKRHAFLMSLDFAIISKTNFHGIILAPGWNNSKGCTMERDRFIKENKEVISYTDLVHSDFIDV